MKKGQKIEVSYFGLDFNYLGVSPFDKTKVEFSIENPFSLNKYPRFYKNFEEIVKSYGGDKFDYVRYPAKLVFELPKKGAEDKIIIISEKLNILLGLYNFNNVFSSSENIKDAEVIYFFWQFKIGLYKSNVANAYILYLNSPIYNNKELSETIAEFIRKSLFSINSVQTKDLGNNEYWIVFEIDPLVNLSKNDLVDFIYWLKDKYETYSKPFKLGTPSQNLQPYFLLPKSDVQIYSIEKTPYYTFTPKNINPFLISTIEEFARKSLPLNDFPSFIKNQDNSFTFTMGNVSYAKQESYFGQLDYLLSSGIATSQSSSTPQASTSTFPPEFFAVENDNSPEFQEFIKWLNKTYGTSYNGSSEFYGYDEEKEIKAVADYINFEGKPKIFTAKEFMDNLRASQMPTSTQPTSTFPPKEFMVKWDNSSDFEDYMEFLNKNYGVNNDSDIYYYDYYGIEYYNGKPLLQVYSDDNDILNLPIFTAKEFMDNLRASQMPIQEEIITKTKKITSSNDYTQQIDQLKKQIAEAMFLKSIISPIEFEKRIELEQSISKKQKEINELNFKTFEEKFEGSQVFDELFDQSFVEIQHDYQNIYSTNTEQEFADLFTPNGKPSVYSDEINELIRTPQFIEWFGDWELAYQYKDVQGIKFDCSKVLNENYEPLIVWHGTGGEFSYFKYDTFPASYFAVNKDYAKWFANLHGGDEGYVLPFFLNVKNPLDLTHFGTREVSTKDFFDYMYLQTGLDMEGLEINPIFADSSFRPVETWVYLRNNPKMLKKISELQIFDGIHFYETNPSVPTGENAHETEVWITFRPDQAKLADPSRGTILMASLKSFILKRGGKI